jgi:cytochrome c oxidase assembly protein subunit 19
MPGFGAPGGSATSYKPSPPERGSFPLDHDAECKYIISSYLRCLRRQNPPGKNNEECRLLAKEYLGCRMEKGLMLKDEWGNLGLDGLKDVKDMKVEGAARGVAGERATKLLEEKKS